MSFFRAVLVATAVAAGSGAHAETMDVLGPETGKIIYQATHGQEPEIREALRQLIDADVTSAIPALILGFRYRAVAENDYREALRALTGFDEGFDWFDWMLWQEAHPEITPHPVYRDIKLIFASRVDPAFLRFIGPSKWNPETAGIRLEEVAWGGVRVDGIPALDNGPWIAGTDAAYLNEDDLVFGVEINGDARAYPLRILGWHEMANDVIGGVPVSLAYCTLCGAAILFESRVDGVDGPLTFGSTGLLYRSNKLMYDRQTDSVWNQFTGEPVSGPLRDLALAGRKVDLPILPVVTATWADWRAKHPETQVLDVETGHNRNYGAGVVYQDYFASPDLMFPAAVDESRLRQKQRVFGLRTVGASKAWDLEIFAGGGSVVLNDSLGPEDVVLIGAASGRTVRAYQRRSQMFSATPDGGIEDQSGSVWSVGEDRLVGPEGETLGRLPGHLAYWFAWNSYFGTDSVLVTRDDL
ncbi:MAG: DUF3179 domain-containing protein [Alphaproteobacteria bacterium]|nr:DUF3179 domain-containing protein [Alphaproteobacteria bacterium]